MKVGVGLPAMLRGVGPDLIFEWARVADDGAFSTLVTGELITTPSYDAMTVLTAAGAATERVRLMTNVLVLPLHNAGILAKQAATMCALTKGRFTLGIGIGGRKPVLYGITGDSSAHANYPDFAAAPASYEGRAARFDGQIELMLRIWSGESPLPDVPPVGPAPFRPGGPEVLIGGFDARAIERAARLANGLTTFDHGADLAKVTASFDLARKGWVEHGRDGEPRLVVGTYFAIGPKAADGKKEFLRTHYHHLSPEGREKLGAVIRLTDATSIREALKAFGDTGADEVVLVPMVPSIDQVERLGELIG
jgi:alkanesulfonate monooxygenase SsuD/methylene tetrahydromethanopterin reductase-like flavin-dependent oxidoreductase (luciferase family)